MSKNTIKVVELFAGVGGFRIGLEELQMPMKPSGTTNGNHQPNTKMLHSYIEHALVQRVIATKILIQYQQLIFLIMTCW